MIYCIDVDGVLCKTENKDYYNSIANAKVIEKVNHLYDQGHVIKIFTGRGSKSGIDWTELTKEQLKSWGLKYHNLIMGKPDADVFIDDHAMNIKDFMNGEKPE